MAAPDILAATRSHRLCKSAPTTRQTPGRGLAQAEGSRAEMWAGPAMAFHRSCSALTLQTAPGFTECLPRARPVPAPGTTGQSQPGSCFHNSPSPGPRAASGAACELRGRPGLRGTEKGEARGHSGGGGGWRESGWIRRWAARVQGVTDSLPLGLFGEESSAGVVDIISTADGEGIRIRTGRPDLGAA